MPVYIQRWNGEWIDVTAERFLACCDCGLVHKEEYRIIIADDGTEHILRRVIRDNRATAGRRCSLRSKKEGIYGKDKRTENRRTCK